LISLRLFFCGRLCATGLPAKELLIDSIPLGGSVFNSFSIAVVFFGDKVDHLRLERAGSLRSNN